MPLPRGLAANRPARKHPIGAAIFERGERGQLEILGVTAPPR